MSRQEFIEKVVKIQTELKAPKNQFNKFGGYNYRNCEDILEAVKPLLKQTGLKLSLKDKPICVGENSGNPRFYIESTAILSDGEYEEAATASARESADKKGMDDSQISGSASSYARKYALNGLFLIDDTKDADATNNHGKKEAKAAPKKPVKKESKPSGDSFRRVKKEDDFDDI